VITLANWGWHLVTGIAISCFVVFVICFFSRHYMSWRLTKMLEEKGLPLPAREEPGPGIWIVNDNLARFGSWCQQVLPDEPMGKQRLLVDRVEGWSFFLCFACTILSANGCFLVQ
jgi:hypothetical protein